MAGRFSIYIDEEFVASVDGGVLVQLGLSEGTSLSPSEIEQLRKSLSDQKLRDTAYRILSRRSHSEKELIRKLRQRGYDHRQIDSLIAEFKEKGYISDEQFAVDWINSRMMLKPRSRRMLEAELAAKGVSKSVISRALDKKLSGTDETNLAFELLERRPSRFIRDNSVDTRRKIYNFLRYRGFGNETIMGATARFIREFCPDNDQ